MPSEHRTATLRAVRAMTRSLSTVSDQGAADAEPTGQDPAPRSRAAKPAAKKAPSKKAAPKAAPAKKTVVAKKAGKKAAAAKKTTSAKKTTGARTPAAKKRATARPTGAAQDQSAPVASDLVAAPAPEPLPPATEAPAATARAFPPDASDIDRPWADAYPPLVPKSYPYPDVPLTRLLDDAAKDFPDAAAMSFLGRPTAYRRLLDQVDRFAAALHGLGVKKSDRVGIVMPNCPQHVVAAFGVLRVGAIVVEIDPNLDDAGLGARINDAGCRVLVVLDPIYAKLERLKGKVPTVEHVVGTGIADYLPPMAAAAFHARHRKDTRLVRKIPATEGVLRFSELLRRHAPAGTQEPVAPGDDIALIAYPDEVPGGVLRGVALTHRNLLASVFQVRLWVPDVQAGRETVLCAVPFWQPYGLTAGLSLGVLSAAAMMLVPSTDADDILATIDKRKPTLFPATGSMVEAIASAPHLRKHDLTSVRVALCDTSLLSADVTATFEDATGGRLREGLALPETTALSHANPVYGKAKADRIGLPLSDTVCTLVDPSDRSRLAAEGERGELAICGPQVMKGYWDRAHDTARVLVDGWLLTGLLAEVDDEGYYCILGRTDDHAPRSTQAFPA